LDDRVKYKLVTLITAHFNRAYSDKKDS